MADTMTAAPAPAPSAAPAKPGGIMRRLNIWTGLAGGLVLGVVGWLIAHPLLNSTHYGDDRVICITMVAWLLGFLIGIGAFTGPYRWLVGRDLTQADHEFMAGKDQGVSRYFRFCTDHKVIGVQYLVLTMVLFLVGGILAMLIRTDLITPGSHLFGLQTYNSVVGLHGIIMIAATIIMVSGPFGNFILPIMIGARDMAFPRLNALSFWLLVPAVPVLLSAAFLGGIPTGWSAYAPLANQAPPGMDAFLLTIIGFALSTAIGGMNITTTAVTMRTRGLTWVRTPIFVYGVVGSVALGLVAFPMFMTSQILLGLDRTAGTTFYDAYHGGSAWLYQNLFWLMGHPEVYVILLPGFAAVLELVPVFCRKPLFSFKGAVAGMAGIVGLSVFVWAHHMYMSGWAPELNGPFMLTTEMISVPTGLLILVLIGTIWRGRVWTRLPMIIVYAVIWNFIIGGVTGIYLSDVPVDQAMHGTLFVVAHFHYTLMGGALTAAMAALTYWFPKMTGKMVNEKWAGTGFWIAQVGFQVTFLAMFALGLGGMPRRAGDYPPQFATANLVATIGAYVIMVGMLVYAGALIASWVSGEVAPANPWGGKTLEWQVPTPVPLENFEVLPVITSDFYTYGETAQGPAAGNESPVKEAVPAGARTGPPDADGQAGTDETAEATR